MSHTNQQGVNRYSVIRGMMSQPCARLLDVGCGPILREYRYADVADEIVCLDWKPVVVGELPDRITVLGGDFLSLQIDGAFDLIVMADVFEHVLLEDELAFAERCTQLLKPGGKLIITVPHAGRYAFLDPYHVKPMICRILHKIGLYKNLHNGYCDIRKLHKHYSLDALSRIFGKLTVHDAKRWGYFYYPLSVWTRALKRKLKFLPGADWIERKRTEESCKDFGEKSYNIAVCFEKPL